MDNVNTDFCLLCHDLIHPVAEYTIDCCEHKFHFNCIKTWVNEEGSAECPHCDTPMSPSDIATLNDPCFICEEKTSQVYRQVCKECRNLLKILIHFYKPLKSVKDYSFLKYLESKPIQSPHESNFMHKMKFLLFLKWNFSWIYASVKSSKRGNMARYLKWVLPGFRIFQLTRKDRLYVEESCDFTKMGDYGLESLKTTICETNDEMFNECVDTLLEYGSLLMETQECRYSKQDDYDLWKSAKQTSLIFKQYENDLVKETLLPFFEKIDTQKLFDPPEFFKVYEKNKLPLGIKISGLKKRLVRFKATFKEPEEIETESLENLFKQCREP